jgi:hypothetical protein
MLLDTGQRVEAAAGPAIATSKTLENLAVPLRGYPSFDIVAKVIQEPGSHSGTLVPSPERLVAVPASQYYPSGEFRGQCRRQDFLREDHIDAVMLLAAGLVEYDRHIVAGCSSNTCFPSFANLLKSECSCY